MKFRKYFNRQKHLKFISFIYISEILDFIKDFYEFTKQLNTVVVNYYAVQDLDLVYRKKLSISKFENTINKLKLKNMVKRLSIYRFGR